MRIGIACLVALACALFSPLPASASVGVNVSPGWGNTVDGRNIPQMERVIRDFRPDALRMPWVDSSVDDGRTRETIRFAIANGIDTLVIDNETWTPERVVEGIARAAADGLTVTGVEGVNEPDVPATGYTPTQVPITAAKLAEVRERQTRLYAAVKSRWPKLPVLCPSAVYAVNEAALSALPCNAASVHRYPLLDGTPPTPDEAALPNVGKPVVVTEVGVTSYRRWVIPPFRWTWAVSPEQQRDYLVRFIPWLRANGAIRVIVYSLQNSGQNLWDGGHNFGLYTWDGYPNPAAAALRG
jgi:hypothetical protein